MLKLLLSGHSAACLAQLRKEGLHHGLLPLLDVIVEQPVGERFLRLALEQTDTRIRTGKSVSPAFLFAALLWHEVLAAWKTNESRDLRSIPALYLAMDQVLDAQTDKLSIPRRLTTTMKEIWALQPRLEQRSGKRALVLLTHPRFRAGYDFMLLRAESGEVAMDLANWWTRFQDAETEERNAMLIPESAPKKRPRRRRKTKAEESPEPAPAQDESGH
jgi:poly(A) polymerase